jgi:hypothetical protein
MRSVHRSKTRGSKCFWCAATSLPLGADWPQQRLPPHASPAAAGGPPIDPMAPMTPDLVHAWESLRPEEWS